ncbi:MAG TPA: gluconate kinase, partial [Acidimicrobiia bacterium]|nr:gluconate kinase [Acidimicrobiia bacterium]
MTSGQAPRATPVTRAEFERWARTRTGDPGIELRETHVSIIALGRERVYKLKKPVRLPFVDQSTAERRRAICGREVTLNRRLAPDVYLGVVDVTGDGGEVVDCAVEMRRMPEDRRLSALVDSGSDVRPCLDALASLLATFHARAARGDEIDAAATAPAIGRAWATELAEMGITESRVGMLARRFIAGRDELFAQRIAAGRVCDGHGDLLADDVFCLPDGPRALDCLEFDDHLRFADGLADAAFCAMSLEQLGRADLAEHFLGCYGGAAGDHWPRSLAHHYVARRALVRSKVAGLRARAEEAAQLLALTLDHLERGRVRLVLVGGPPATGKSTL